MVARGTYCEVPGSEAAGFLGALPHIHSVI